MNLSCWIIKKDDSGEYIDLNEDEVVGGLYDDIWEAIRNKYLKHLPVDQWKPDITSFNEH